VLRFLCKNEMKKKFKKRGKIFLKVKDGKVKPSKIEKPTKTLKKKIYGKKKKIPVTIQPKLRRFLPTVYQRKPKENHRAFGLPQKLRKSLTPGTVSIVLCGRFAGKRVIFLKQLESGLCLATGPFKINGVPLRRFHQRHLIATSTKVDLTGLNLPKEVSDTLFLKEKVKKPTKSESDFFYKTR